MTLWLSIASFFFIVVYSEETLFWEGGWLFVIYIKYSIFLLWSIISFASLILYPQIGNMLHISFK